jgi:ubiquinone/menaquinone biosynthesis C-methylase UbiE
VIESEEDSMNTDTTTNDKATFHETFWNPISKAGKKTAMIHAGLELRVWEKIAAGYRTAQDLAQHEGWDPTGTRALLDALFAIDLLDKDATGYHLVPIAEQTLLPASPDYQGSDLLMDWAALGHSQLADAIRTGKRPLIADVGGESQAAAWATLSGTHGFYAPDLVVPQWYWSRVDSLWCAAGIEARDGLRVLDVGSGPGVVSMALARQHRGVHATLMDRQPELDLARAVAEKQGLSHQLTMIPGDMRTLDYGRNQFDVVLFAYSLMFFGTEEHVNLLRKAQAALVPGGTLILSQFIADDARRTRKGALINALWIYASTAQGDAYTTSECVSFLEEAGFVNAVERELTENEAVTVLIRAIKP